MNSLQTGCKLMSVKDILITITLLVGISVLLFVTGLVRVHDYYVDDSGVKYYFDEKKNFTYYYDETLGQKIGFYNEHDDVYFYYDESKAKWLLLEEASTELSGIVPLVTGDQFIENGRTYYFVKDHDFVYFLDEIENIYIGFYPKAETILYYYKPSTESWIELSD